MWFFGRLSLKHLMELCRTLRHYLAGGLTVLDAFRQMSRKGPAPLRSLARRVTQRLENGDDLEDSLRCERGRLPPLFLSLAKVGEQTGNLPEVMHELEKYFMLQKRLRTLFWSQSFWPILQFFAAIFVVAGMIFLIGILSPPGREPWDPLGFGLTGPTGAAIFLSMALGSVAAVVLAFFGLTNVLQQRAAVDAGLLNTPVLGPALRALALTRYCLAQRLTLETGMTIGKAVRLSFEATGNAAFVRQADLVIKDVKQGEELAPSLAATRLFPEEFIHIVTVGEESGRLTEVLEQQGEHYQEESQRLLVLLAQAAGWGVWLVVAVMIIFVIFRIFFTYINIIDQLAR